MIKIIEWIATIISVIGAFLLAFRYFQQGYTLFIVGMLICIYLELKKKSRYNVVLNCVYLITSLIGFYHAI